MKHTPILQHTEARTLEQQAAIRRAAEVERLSSYSPANRAWWQQDCRLADAEWLRRALVEKHVVPIRVNSREMGQPWNPAAAIKRMETHEHIAKVCAWAMRRMKRADEAFALRFTPVRNCA